MKSIIFIVYLNLISNKLLVKSKSISFELNKKVNSKNNFVKSRLLSTEEEVSKPVPESSEQGETEAVPKSSEQGETEAVPKSSEKEVSKPVSESSEKDVTKAEPNNSKDKKISEQDVTDPNQDNSEKVSKINKNKNDIVSSGYKSNEKTSTNINNSNTSDKSNTLNSEFFDKNELEITKESENIVNEANKIEELVKFLDIKKNDNKESGIEDKLKNLKEIHKNLETFQTGSKNIFGKFIIVEKN